jgi:hypothetical protein
MIEHHLRTEWDDLVAKMAAAEAALPFGLPDDHELLVAVDAISSELDDCARRIIKERATNVADIRLLAEARYWTQWVEPTSLDVPEADALLARAEGDLGDDGVVALLRGIRGAL